MGPTGSHNVSVNEHYNYLAQFVHDWCQEYIAAEGIKECSTWFYQILECTTLETFLDVTAYSVHLDLLHLSLMSRKTSESPSQYT